MKFQVFKKILSLLIVMAVLFGLTGCSNSKEKDIVVLFTGDVSCAVESNIGYSGLLAYKKVMQSKTPYVTLVDLGNAIQGDYIGTISKGTYVVDVMNQVGYDFALLGNHEFDYGMEQLSSLISRSKAKYLACNIVYKGLVEENNPLKETKPYEIVKYGNKKVAFIGVTTPNALTKTNPSNFKENDEIVYDFKNAANANKLYTVVQGFVNEVRNKGADYVVILSHLGDTNECRPYTSTGLIKSTFDVDVVLDAHAGSEISGKMVKNKNGDDVILSACGTELANIGKLVISPNGLITTGLVSGYTSKDSGFDSYYTELKTIFEEDKNQVLAMCDTALKRTDENGIELIRSRETPLGNFCADAYRVVADADVALVAGSTIQGDLPVGDIRYFSLLNLQQQGGSLCKVTVTGQEIVDALEIASMYTQFEYENEGKPIGVSDMFMQVSGLKFTIDTSVNPSVEFDEFGMFKEVEGERRVKNVFILNRRGSYIPINLNAEYTLASNNLITKEGFGGINLFADNSFVFDDSMPDYQVILEYLNKHLEGRLGARYSAVEGRINIK